jgi:hypothetical protein
MTDEKVQVAPRKIVHRFFVLLCFHKYRRMHLHFFEGNEPEAGARTVKLAPDALEPDHWYLARDTFFRLPLFSSTSPDAPSFLSRCPADIGNIPSISSWEPFRGRT